MKFICALEKVLALRVMFVGRPKVRYEGFMKVCNEWIMMISELLRRLKVMIAARDFSFTWVNKFES